MPSRQARHAPLDETDRRIPDQRAVAEQPDVVPRLRGKRSEQRVPAFGFRKDPKLGASRATMASIAPVSIRSR